ncbi:protein transport protein Sec31A-like [Tubulanus polymorphus]|uniref:protein transport protein Sec31A-like n=1 Tax=Tubulanus polymorphus TaxID=672921 RepID=UPI003DA62388
MRVKEIRRTANIAWSPATQHPVYIAAGTAAQQLDATFSTNAALEIYGLNLADNGKELNLAGSINTDCRFHKLAWSSHGMSSPDSSSGVLCGGGDNGNLFMWNPSKILSSDEPLVYKSDKHTGAVVAMDFNPFQTNLLATGATDSEIYIWDLNNPTKQMTPGAKSMPPDDVACVAWNQQVQHILGSTFAARCVVWDLRKNEPIIKISDSMSRIKTKLICWHPETATQMCLASEDDHTPVIQLWDLRFATSPLKVLESHQRGILSLAWCPQDPDLLLSCGKDNRILCWNPSSNIQGGEVVYELPTSSQWSYDVQWCPRNPAIISSCSFDGHISICSLMGNDIDAQPTNQMNDSFPSDPFHQAQAQFQQQPNTGSPIVPLKKPPKWLRRPCGASFGFGGKLISFGNTKLDQQQQQHQPTPREVHVSQVVTEADILHSSNQLETALSNHQLTEFCNLKIENSTDEHDKNIWKFLKTNFHKDPRQQFLELIGYNRANLVESVSCKTKLGLVNGNAAGIDAGELAQRMAQLESNGEFQSPAKEISPRVSGSQTPGDKKAENSEAIAEFDHIASHKGESRSESPFPISTADDVDGLVNQNVLIGNFEAAVEMCLYDERWAEAIILAIAGGPDLLSRTQKKYFDKNKDTSSRLISSVVTGNWTHVIQTCDLDNWKEALALALTYAQADDFVQLCDMLGTRLEIEGHGELAINAALCYICSGNVEKLVACWARLNEGNSSSQALQDLVEKVMILRKSVEISYGEMPEIKKGELPHQLSRYAGILAAQGSLDTAINYIGVTNEPSLLVLRDRLYHALGNAASELQKPPCPFQKMIVEGKSSKSPQPQSFSCQSQQQPRYEPRTGFKEFGHQSQAGNTFQTTTSPSQSSFQPLYIGGYNNLPSSTRTSFSQQHMVAPGLPAGTTTLISHQRGGLSHKYPGASSANDPYVNTYSQGDIFTPDIAPQPSAYTSGNMYPMQSLHPEPSTNIYNPASIGVSGDQTHLSQSVPLHNIPSYMESRPDVAWNDPPALRSTARKSTPQASAYDPITMPIFNPEISEAPTHGMPGGQMAYNGTPATMYSPQVHQQAEKPQRPEPVTPVQKGPVPPEHIVLQNILDELVKRCLQSAPNPHLKRKLEDVCRKLETLYDKLRDSALSPSVTSGLHQIVQAIQQFNYANGLAIHAQMVSQGNFSEISSFMPGIKVLLQTALQMNVNLQQ